MNGGPGASVGLVLGVRCKGKGCHAEGVLLFSADNHLVTGVDVNRPSRIATVNSQLGGKRALWGRRGKGPSARQIRKRETAFTA